MRHPSNIPKNLMILGKKWKVVLVKPGTLGDAAGLATADKKLIQIENSGTKDEILQVFWHEFFHAFLQEVGASHSDFISGLAEEMLADTFSHVILANFKLVPNKTK